MQRLGLMVGAVLVGFLTSLLVGYSIGGKFNGNLMAGGASRVGLATWEFSSRSMNGALSLVVNSDVNLSKIIPGAGKTKTSTKSLAKVGEGGLVMGVTTSPLTLAEKINRSREVTKELLYQLNLVDSQISMIKLRWEEIEATEAADIVSQVNIKLGNVSDGEGSDSIFGRVKYLSNNWGFHSTKAMMVVTLMMRTDLTALEKSLETWGKVAGGFSRVEKLATNISVMEQTVGVDRGLVEEGKVFGELAGMEGVAQVIKNQNMALNEILTTWDSYTKEQREERVKNIMKQIYQINRVPQTEEIFSPTATIDGKLVTVLGELLKTNEMMAVGTLGAMVTVK